MMRRGTDALGQRIALLLCAVLCGCTSGPVRRNPVIGRTTAPPRPLAQTAPQPPAPDLRIPAQVQAPQPPPTQTANPKPPVTVPPTTEPVVPAAATAVPAAQPASNPMESLRNLQREAAERYAAVDSYIVRLHRREQIGGKDQPEELMLFKFRKQPWSVHMKWIGEEAKGREVIFVKGHHDNKLHTRLAAGDVPLMPAGKRMAFDPNSALVRSSSRRPITDAGIGSLIERFTTLVTALEQGDATRGTLKYLGRMQRPEYPQPCEAVEQTIPPGRDPNLTQGGRRWWFFDTVTRFPTLMITHDHTGRTVEYYCHDRFELNVRLDQDDFNPDRLWGK